MASYLSSVSQLSLALGIASHVAWTVSNASINNIMTHSAPALLSMAAALHFGTLNKSVLGSLVAHSIGTEIVSVVVYKAMQYFGINSDLALEQCIERNGLLSTCGLAKIFLDNVPIAIITVQSFNVLGDTNVNSIASSVRYAIMHGPAVAAVGVPATLLTTYLAQSAAGWNHSEQAYNPNSALFGMLRYTTKYGIYAVLGVATLPLPQKVLATSIIGGLAQALIHSKVFSWNEYQDALFLEFSMGAINSAIYAIGATALMNVVSIVEHPLGKALDSYIVPSLAECVEGSLRELWKYNNYDNSTIAINAYNAQPPEHLQYTEHMCTSGDYMVNASMQYYIPEGYIEP